MLYLANHFVVVHSTQLLDRYWSHYHKTRAKHMQAKMREKENQNKASNLLPDDDDDDFQDLSPACMKLAKQKGINIVGDGM
jgi:hypothetical protein